MKRKIKIISLITIIISLLFVTKSNAAMQANGGNRWVNISVSESYDACYNLRNSDSSLGKNSLDPHLILNSDWAAFAYLAASSYGVRDQRNTTYGNPTGVIGLGNSCQTAGLIEGFNESNGYYSKLVQNKDTKYVEIVEVNRTAEGTKGKAIGETWGWDYNVESWPRNVAWTDFSSDKRLIIRESLYGILNGEYYGCGNGEADNGTSFRPAIWN